MLSHPAAGWRIRPFEYADHQACAKLLSDCIPDFDWPGAPVVQISPFLHSLTLNEAWVAEEDQAGIVGCLTMIPQDAYVEYLLVARNWRLCGIARGLLQTARSAAGKPLLLTVDKQNKAARRAYAAMGWRPTGSANAMEDRARIRLLSS